MKTLAAPLLGPVAFVCGAIGVFTATMLGIHPFAGLAIGVSAVSAIFAWRSTPHTRCAALSAVLAVTVAYWTAVSVRAANITPPLTPDRFASPSVPWLPLLIAVTAYVTCAALVRYEASVRSLRATTTVVVVAIAALVIASAPRSLTSPGIGNYLDQLPLVASVPDNAPLSTELEANARLVRSCATCEVRFIGADGQQVVIHSYIGGVPFTVRRDRRLGLWFFVADVGPGRRVEAVNAAAGRVTPVDVRVLGRAIGPSFAVWAVALLGAVAAVGLSLRRSASAYATAIALLLPSSAPLIGCAVLGIAF